MFLWKLIRFAGKSLENEDKMIVTGDGIKRQVVAGVVCSSRAGAVNVLICSNSSLREMTLSGITLKGFKGQTAAFTSQ